MKKRGKKAKPNALKIADGTTKRLNLLEPPTTIASLDPPAVLTGEALEEWKRIAPELHYMGILKQIDRLSLELYCLNYAKFREAQRMVKQHGAVEKTKYSQKRSAWEQILSDKMYEIRLWLSEFGATPSSRAKMVVPKGTAPGHKKNIFAQTAANPVKNGDEAKKTANAS